MQASRPHWQTSNILGPQTMCVCAVRRAQRSGFDETMTYHHQPRAEVDRMSIGLFDPLCNGTRESFFRINRDCCAAEIGAKPNSCLYRGAFAGPGLSCWLFRGYGANHAQPAPPGGARPIVFWQLAQFLSDTWLYTLRPFSLSVAVARPDAGFLTKLDEMKPGHSVTVPFRNAGRFVYAEWATRRQIAYP